MKKLFFIAAISLLFFGCQSKDSKELTDLKARYEKETPLGKTELFIMKNEGGIEVRMSNYGARIISIIMPDNKGNYSDVALGLKTIDEYLNEKIYLGCIVGRFANRIDSGKFSIDGIPYQASVNSGKNMLHGGFKGFDKVMWKGVQQGNSVEMTYTSPDMEEGFPGEVQVKQVFTLTPENEIVMEFSAVTNKKTIINLTNHTYLNLKGEGNGDILGHLVTINADTYTPVDSILIPTGEIASVDNTPFDFRSAQTVGSRVNDANEQLKFGLGYDHNWVLKKDSTELSFACRLFEETTGRMLEVYTTEPGLQFYCGNFMDGSLTGKAGLPYNYRNALIFEPQHFPDSPNHKNFPSTVLEPGKKYYHKSIYKFSVR
jgi:aldose 1-epimerase